MRRFFKKLFGGANERDNTTKVNIPPDWRHTIADLMNDLKNGKREQIGEPKLTWAREYERSLIPVNYRFPKKGDLYQAKFDQVIDYLTAWSAPYTGSGTATKVNKYRLTQTQQTKSLSVFIPFLLTIKI